MEPGNLVLRHSIPIKTLRSLLSFEFLKHNVLSAGLLSERVNKNMKCFIIPSENRIHNRLVIHLCYDGP